VKGTRYVYDQLNANEEISKVWVHSELASAANTYQTFPQNIWQAIIKRTSEGNQRQMCQATQLSWVNNVLVFLAEANTAHVQHLATFQGNMKFWVAEHQRKVARLERELR